MVALSESRRDLLLALLALLGMVAVLYGQTLDVPFYLDDHGALEENHRLRDLSAALGGLLGPRGLTWLSFAVNFRLSGWAPAPLHLTNIALHAACGFLVWRLLCQLLAGRWLPLLGALLFVAHPLQTQSVTYLVQRSTLLATLLVLVAVLCHRRARTVLAGGARHGDSAWLWPWLGAVLAGAVAVLAKENAATLPLLLFAHDRLFPSTPPRTVRQTLLDCLPYCLAPMLVGAAILPAILTGSELTSQAGGLLSLAHNSPLNYLVTQFSVLWVYLRLLLLPYGQALEHDYPVVAGLFEPHSLVALVGWLVVAWSLWRLRRQRPLLVFGAVWFFCGLAVESSLIPLDPLFEQRLYLPMTGFLLVLLDGVTVLLGERRTVLVLGLALLLCLPLSWRRNALWREPIAFYEENLRLHPRSERVLLGLLLEYKEARRTTDAERLARELTAVNPRFNVGWRELAGLMAARGAGAESLAAVDEGLRHSPQDPDLYRAGAAAYLSLGQREAAVGFLRRGVAAAPRNATMRNWLAALHFELGELHEAEAAYRESLQLDDAAPGTHKNLARVLYAQGRMAEAFSELQRASERSPGSPDILQGLGMTALAMGDLETARAAAAKLRYSDPEAWRELQSAIAP